MKQMIVLRKDLKMRKGKMVAQGAHASLAAILPFAEAHGHDGYQNCSVSSRTSEYRYQLGCVKEWLAGSFKKVCVSVNSENELAELLARAKLAGVITADIWDDGATEFNGVKTFTCIAIGPDTDERLAPLTGQLELL